MQKSLFYEWVDKHFPNLVISIAETLNGRSLTNQIPFLFTDMLDNEYSPDSRWQSISGKYQNVAADVVALGAPTTIQNVVTGAALLAIVALTARGARGSVVK